MYSFAHLADCHLGFQKQEKLQELEQEIFENALDTCIKKEVDFILISGDLFHTSLPDMRVVRYAFQKFKEVYEKNIPIYIVYGSHDYSVNHHSVIDLLTDVGYLRRADNVRDFTDKLHLDFITDSATGAKIVGLPGRTTSLDKKYYQKLDREMLEQEDGFKIFLFHIGIDELATRATPEMDSMPMSLLPRGFDYYAGGHVHTKAIEDGYDGYGTISYPGTIFAGHPADFEASARGMPRGFIIVSFDDGITDVSFVPAKRVDFEMVSVDANDKTSARVQEEIKSKVENIDSKEKIVILKVAGELSSGKTSEVELTKISEGLKDDGAINVDIKRSQFSSKEYNITPVKGDNREEVVKNILSENIGEVKMMQPELLGEQGVALAQKLLHKLKEPKSDETSANYERRITQDARELLGLDRD